MGEPLTKEERIKEMKDYIADIKALLNSNAPILLIEKQAWRLYIAARTAIIDNAEIEWEAKDAGLTFPQ